VPDERRVGEEEQRLGHERAERRDGQREDLAVERAPDARTPDARAPGGPAAVGPAPDGPVPTVRPPGVRAAGRVRQRTACARRCTTPAAADVKARRASGSSEPSEIGPRSAMCAS
jgi:hypothetical protein